MVTASEQYMRRHGCTVLFLRCLFCCVRGSQSLWLRRGRSHTTDCCGEEEGCGDTLLFCYFGKKHTTELQSPSDGSSSNVWDEALFVASAVK